MRFIFSAFGVEEGDFWTFWHNALLQVSAVGFKMAQRYWRYAMNCS